MAGLPHEFTVLCNTTAERLERTPAQIAKNYWLVSALHAVAIAEESCNIRSGKTGELLAVTAFSGGTSLVAAWDIAERHSEDIDLLVLAAQEKLPHSALRRVLRESLKPVMSAFGSAAGQPEVIVHSNLGFKNMIIPMNDGSDEIRVESTVESSPQGLPIITRRKVVSCMGWFASEELMSQFPELGGFEMECATPEYTALNKLDALHRRAVEGNYKGILGRSRDLYDLARIALTEHGKHVRPLLEASKQRVARPLSHRPMVPRPIEGYAASLVFAPGSEAYSALAKGYEETVDTLIWGDAPVFEEAIELAMSLDR